MKFVNEIIKNMKLSPRSHLPTFLQWNLWIHSLLALAIGTCLTSRQNRFTSIWIFCRTLLLCLMFQVRP